MQYSICYVCNFLFLSISFSTYDYFRVDFRDSSQGSSVILHWSWRLSRMASRVAMAPFTSSIGLMGRSLQLELLTSFLTVSHLYTSTMTPITLSCHLVYTLPYERLLLPGSCKKRLPTCAITTWAFLSTPVRRWDTRDSISHHSYFVQRAIHGCLSRNVYHCLNPLNTLGLMVIRKKGTKTFWQTWVELESYTNAPSCLTAYTRRDAKAQAMKLLLNNMPPWWVRPVQKACCYTAAEISWVWFFKKKKALEKKTACQYFYQVLNRSTGWLVR